MSTIGGPGGIGGPKGPKPSGSSSELGEVDGTEPADVGDVRDVGTSAGLSGVRTADAMSGATNTDLDKIAAELAAGKLTPHEAVDRLVDQIAGTEELGPADRAELRELMSDLIAHDPHLAGLVGRI